MPGRDGTLTPCSGRSGAQRAARARGAMPRLLLVLSTFLAGAHCADAAGLRPPGCKPHDYPCRGEAQAQAAPAPTALDQRLSSKLHNESEAFASAPSLAPAAALAVPAPRGGDFSCRMSCLGDAATTVPLPGGDSDRIAADSPQVCREFCAASPDCEAFVFGKGMCYGKRNVHTALCAQHPGFVTEMLKAMPFGTCALLGDPQILTFDNPHGHFDRLLQLGAGDYWLMKSAVLHIQGRFGYSARFPAAASAVGIAITGALIQGHRLTAHYVGPDKGYRGFKVLWDGKEILGGGFPATFGSDVGILKATLANMKPEDFHAQARRATGGDGGGLPSLLFEIFPEIRIYMLLDEETANIIINLRRPGGIVDGYCGSFDCDSEDDSFADLLARGVAAPIKNGSLFEGAPPSPPSQMTPRGRGPKDVDDCDPAVLNRAREACGHPDSAIRRACIFDVCASNSTGAARGDVAAGAVVAEMQQHYELLILRLPALLGARLPAGSHACLAAMLVALAGLGAIAGCKSRSGHARRIGFVRVAAQEEAEDEEAMQPAGEYDEDFG